MTVCYLTNYPRELLDGRWRVMPHCRRRWWNGYFVLIHDSAVNGQLPGTLPIVADVRCDAESTISSKSFDCWAKAQEWAEELMQ